MSAFLDRIFNRSRRRKATAPHVRMMEGASVKRWDNVPPFGPIGAELTAARSQIRGRARHLRFNDPTAGNAIEIIKSALVGYGVTAASLADDDNTRELHDSAFSQWCEKTNFPALLTEIVDALATDGESLLIMRAADDNALRLQHVPAEQLDESLNSDPSPSTGRYIEAGIEYNTDDRAIAYHFRPARPTDLHQSFRPPVRVDAADVIHIFRPLGAGQTRGVSWLAPVIVALNEHSKLVDALVTNANVQSMLCGFLVDQNGTHPNPLGDDVNLTMEPGLIRVLPSGYDWRQTNPQQMAQSIDLVAVSLRAIAAGLQIPEFLLSGDMRGVNYSSARTALVQFRQHIEAIQHTILVPALNRIWQRWQLLESLRGDNAADPESAVEWHFPKPQWVDPQSDAKATRDMLDMGLISRRMAVAQLGFDVVQVDTEIAADRAREKSLNLNFGENGNAHNGKPGKSDEDNAKVEA